MIVARKELDALRQGAHSHPHAILGMHPISHNGQHGLVVRAFVQDAVTCEVVDYEHDGERRFPMQKFDDLGFFETFIADRPEVFRYRLRIERYNGEIRQFHDPYRFLPTLSDHDLYLFNEGTEHRVYNKLGAHPRVIDGVPGVSFAVWAPNATRVSVVGDFCGWDGRYFPMRPLGNAGVWELFIPGLGPGLLYKFEIVPRRGAMRLKTDPFGVYFESPPNNASIIWDLSKFKWHDQEWLAHRERNDWANRPVSVYEVHLGSWRRKVEDGNRPLTYRDMAEELATYVKEMGYTHVEFLPLAEYPFDGSWGYQVTGFYAPTHRYGNPNDFMHMVDTLHRHGVGVILDWVPAHFPKDFFALPHFDGTHLYEHADPRKGEHQDWGTLIFNYGRPEVRCFLVGSALAWMDRFHIDGLRVDAVASMLYLDYSRRPGQWIPNKYGGRENIEAIDFLRYANDTVHKYFPGALMIAEESTAWGGVTKPTREGGLGFDFKWNMGWMHDTLKYFQKDPIHRKWHHNQLTFGMIYQQTERFMMTFSHDEVVHGKASMLIKMGAYHIPDKSRQLRALYGWMWAWPGKKTLFMGSEFGQSSEWTYDRSLDWHLLQYEDHAGIRRLVSDLNRFYRKHEFIGRSDHDAQSFKWINCDDAANSVYSFVRHGHKPEELLVVVGSFTPVPRQYRIGVPREGTWAVVLNTGAAPYGGGKEPAQRVKSEPIAWNGRSCSIHLNLPGMSTLYLLPADLLPAEEAEPAEEKKTEPETEPEAEPASKRSVTAVAAPDEKRKSETSKLAEGSKS